MNMEDATPQPNVVAAVNDLMFGSRIRAAAAATGSTCVFVRSQDELLRRAAQASLVLLDLDTRWLDAPAAISALRSDAAAENRMVVAFGAHVDGEALRAARAAGADRVLARSAFVKLLPELLAGYGR